VPAGWELGRGEAIYPKLHVEIAAEPGAGNADLSVLRVRRKSFVKPRQIQIF